MKLQPRKWACLLAVGMATVGLVKAAETATNAAAVGLKLASVFKENAVLQREREIPVWGWAAPGATVQVQLGEAKVSAAAGKDGQWLVKLPSQKAGGPLSLKVECGGVTVTFTNVLVGDVWLCSGQSNMAFGLGAALGASNDIAAADFPQIRQLNIQPSTAVTPQADATVYGPWKLASPKTAGSFTAVGFYFAREVYRRTGVPIGLIYATWSGTSIGPWWSPEGLASVPELASVAQLVRQQGEDYRKALPAALDAREAWLKNVRRFLADQGAVPTTNAVAVVRGRLADLEAQSTWIQSNRAALASSGALTAPPVLPPDLAAVLGLPTNQPALSVPALPPNVPGQVSSVHAIYNATIRPLAPYAIKGVLWYQGENNGMEGESYFHKMRALINGWRQLWGEGDFPFYFVQLPAWQKSNDNPAGGDGWPGIRAAQAKSLTITNTGMAVTIDVGDAENIHPPNKLDVGQRLALWALAKDYGQTNVVYSGPMYREMKVEDGKVRLSFDHVGGGLMVGKKEGRAEVVEDKDGKLARFAVAGANKVWQWAEARIERDSVVVWNEKVPAPVAVRYAYSWNPAGANLYNRAGLPAGPFRTDSW